MRCAALLALLAVVTQTQGAIIAVYAVNRHGARQALPKAANLSEALSAGGPSLLPQGHAMCHGAGT
jgi:hypothetical protein